MKKSILSGLLAAVMMLNMSGCIATIKKSEKTTSAATYSTTTAVTTAITSTTATTTTVAEAEDEPVETTKPVESTKPADTTTAKPVETTGPVPEEKPVETIQSYGAYKNVTITYNPKTSRYVIDWDDVPGGRGYRLDVDRYGYTDNGGICDELRQTNGGTFKAELVKPGEVVYVKIRCTVYEGRPNEKEEIFEGKFMIPDPADYAKPDVPLGEFTGEPDITWDGRYIYVSTLSVPGAEKYCLSIDSERYTDNGDLCTETKEISPWDDSEKIALSSFLDQTLPHYVYIRVTAYKGGKSAKAEFKYNTYTEKLFGDAKYIDGKTIIVSIFADDPTTKWTDSAADKQMTEDVWESMRHAVEWLESSTAKYGANSEFIWDWRKDSKLKLTASFGVELDIPEHDRSFEVTDGNESSGNHNLAEKYSAQKDYIENIESRADELKKKYNADNIVYIYIINTDGENQANCHAYSYSRYRSETEFINIYTKEHGRSHKANTYAHEILHLFGTHDLYCESDIIPQSYVDHLDANGCNSIMYYGQSKDIITREFTDLEAYYTGLINYHEDVEKWGLGKSDFYVGH